MKERSPIEKIEYTCEPTNNKQTRMNNNKKTTTQKRKQGTRTRTKRTKRTRKQHRELATRVARYFRNEIKLRQSGWRKKKPLKGKEKETRMKVWKAAPRGRNYENRIVFSESRKRRRGGLVRSAIRVRVWLLIIQHLRTFWSQKGWPKMGIKDTVCHQLNWWRIDWLRGLVSDGDNLLWLVGVGALSELSENELVEKNKEWLVSDDKSGRVTRFRSRSRIESLTKTLYSVVVSIHSLLSKGDVHSRGNESERFHCSNKQLLNQSELISVISRREQGFIIITFFHPLLNSLLVSKIIIWRCMNKQPGIREMQESKKRVKERGSKEKMRSIMILPPFFLARFVRKQRNHLMYEQIKLHWFRVERLLHDSHQHSCRDRRRRRRQRDRNHEQIESPTHQKNRKDAMQNREKRKERRKREERTRTEELKILSVTRREEKRWKESNRRIGFFLFF